MKILMSIAILLASAMAQASTVYHLPYTDVFVTPNWNNTTTVVTVQGVTYRGPSAYYYVSECFKADGASYHCDVRQEDNVVLTADGNTGQFITVSLRITSTSVLIRSGHNYWRHSDFITDGTVTIP